MPCCSLLLSVLSICFLLLLVLVLVLVVFCARFMLVVYTFVLYRLEPGTINTWEVLLYIWVIVSGSCAKDGVLLQGVVRTLKSR